ncbi:MAG: TlyA family RNA methyltransferase [Aerococcus sp.]|nr:TlyA family RNA methyltransferase [Aerococcus sp.]
MKKERVDVLVVQQGITDSREKAKRLIMAGEIYDQNQQRLDKPGQKIDSTSQLHQKGNPLPYVSRGGLKLKKALDTFEIAMAGRNVLDIGSSTGGFTDVSLQEGALHCYALDVGTNQLVWKLRNDERVTVMEQTNFRYSQPDDFQAGQPDIAVTDVSFISLRLIFPPLQPILQPDAPVIALIKPQFEAGRELVGKKGIVHDEQVHRQVIEQTFQMATALGYDVLGLTFSPITGGEGNIEFLGYFTNAKRSIGEISSAIDIRAVVKQAHETFAKQ